MTDTFFHQLGGQAAVDGLAETFYRRVLADPELIPLFHDPTEDHAGRMAWWLTELFGGPRIHTERRGGFNTMVRAHVGLNITEAQRVKWLDHMLASANERKMPAPLLATYREYLETASRLAAQGSRR